MPNLLKLNLVRFPTQEELDENAGGGIDLEVLAEAWNEGTKNGQVIAEDHGTAVKVQGYTFLKQAWFTTSPA